MAEQQAITLDDGAQTIVEQWGSSGPVMLCVHGMTSSRRSWERLAKHYEGRFRVIAYDQRGHGDSATVRGPMKLSRGIADTENVIAALREKVDVLIGHSWGGAVAIEAGRHAPVRRVAAIDPMFRQVDADWYDEYLVELREQFALVGEARDALIRQEYAQWHPIDVEAKVHAVATMTADPIEGLMRENPFESWDLRATIAHYQKPLWLGLASRGESISDEETLDDVETNHTKSVEIAWFPGAGHNVHRTAFDAFVGKLDDWLSRT